MSINGFNLNLTNMKYGLQQGSILSPLLFFDPFDIKSFAMSLLFYINIYLAFCDQILYKVHHFADDTKLMNFRISVKTINKQKNHDLKSLSNWLNADKISLNVSKTELAMFKPSKKTALPWI